MTELDKDEYKYTPESLKLADYLLEGVGVENEKAKIWVARTLTKELAAAKERGARESLENARAITTGMPDEVVPELADDYDDYVNGFLMAKGLIINQLINPFSGEIGAGGAGGAGKYGNGGSGTGKLTNPPVKEEE